MTNLQEIIWGKGDGIHEPEKQIMENLIKNKLRLSQDAWKQIKHCFMLENLTATTL